MDRNDRTKSGPGQNQSLEPPGSDKPKAEPDKSEPDHGTLEVELPGQNKSEPPRKCKLCGGPNHHGCGCEAKARLSDLPKVHYLIDAQALCCSAEPTDKGTEIQYEVTCPECNELMKAKPKQPLDDLIDPEKFNDLLEDVLSVPAIKVMHDQQLKSFKNIKTTSEALEGLCALMYDVNNYLKLITGDIITIRKALAKENEVQNVDGNQN